MVKKNKRSSTIDISSVPGKIVSVNSIRKPLRIAIYSKPKVGKTTFCATAPKVLIVDCNEEGTLSIRDSGVDATYIKEFEEINLIYWFLARGKHKYETVAIDTISSLQTMGLDYVMGEAASLDLSKDPKMPDRRDYGKLSVIMNDVIYNFRNLHMNVIFTAHERSSEEEEGEVQIYPDLTPRVRQTFTGAVDIIGRLYIKELDKNGKRSRERRMLVGSHDKFISGDRSGKLGYIFKNPTFPRIIGRINGGKETDGQD